MHDKQKTKAQLIEELGQLRRQLAAGNTAASIPGRGEGGGATATWQSPGFGAHLATRWQVQRRLREAVGQMESSDDFRQVLLVLRAGLVELGIDFQDCGVNLVNLKGELLASSVNSLGGDKNWTYEETPQWGAVMLCQFWKGGVPVYRRDLDAEDRYREREDLIGHYGHKIRSVVDVPFAYGTLAVNSALPNAFSPEHISDMQFLTEVLEEALRRNWDLRRLEQRNRDLENEVAARRQAEEALKASLREKEVLLKEVHHRVKNNLQVVTSLLHLEADRATDPAAAKVFDAMDARMRSISLLHEILYRSGNLAEVDLAAYLEQLAVQVFHTQSDLSGAVRLELDLGPARLEIDQVIPCGLIVTELATNSLKHGFPGGRTGVVRIGLQAVAEGAQLRLQVSDDGVGLPADFEAKRGKSLGLQLVAALTQQLQGTLAVEPGPGAAFSLVFAPKQHSGSS